MRSPTPAEATERLLGRAPDRVVVLVERPDHSAYRVEIAGECFVAKFDDDPALVAREAQGHARAAEAGIPVPELVAVAEHGIAMRFVEGASLGPRSPVTAWRAAGEVLRRVHDCAPGDLTVHPLGLARASWIDALDALVDRELRDCVRDLGFDRAQAARIRRSLAELRTVIVERRPVWCHGDCQPEHVLGDPVDGSVVAIIDWADHGRGDAAWDLAVLTLDAGAPVDALLAAYGIDEADDETRVVIDVYRVVRHLGEARWFANHALPGAAADALHRAATWAPRPQP